jgi:hypothetical protein
MGRAPAAVWCGWHMLATAWDNPRVHHYRCLPGKSHLCHDAEVIVDVPHLADDLTITIQVLQSHNGQQLQHRNGQVPQSQLDSNRSPH